MDKDSSVQYVCELYVKGYDPWTLIVLSCIFLLLSFTYNMFFIMVALFQYIPENVILNIVFYFICAFIILSVHSLFTKCMTFSCFH